MDRGTLKKCNVYLRCVSNNLNRSYRTCEYFGIQQLYLVNCENAKLKGNLFKSKDRVKLSIVENLPTNEETLYFETDGDISLSDINLSKYTNFCLGGESKDLPRNKHVKRIKINGIGKVSGLTVEGALSIILYKLNEDLKNEK